MIETGLKIIVPAGTSEKARTEVVKKYIRILKPEKWEYSGCERLGRVMRITLLPSFEKSYGK